MFIFNASVTTADRVNMAGYCSLLIGAGFAVATVMYSGRPAMFSGLASAGFTIAGILATFWASVVRDQHSDRQVAQAHDEAAKANSRAAELNEKAEQERLSRVRLEQRVAWRRIDAESASKISERLVEKPSSVAVFHISNDTEAQNLAQEVQRIFQMSKWSVATASISYSDILPRGLHIPQVNEECAFARQILADAGLHISDTPLPKPASSHGGANPFNPQERVVIVIGAKKSDF